MKETILIAGFCPERYRAGYFDLESILRVSPRILKKEGEQQIEIGRAAAIEQKGLFKKRYILRVHGGKGIPLEFYRKDKGDKILLGLPGDYGFGREILEEQTQ